MKSDEGWNPTVRDAGDGCAHGDEACVEGARCAGCRADAEEAAYERREDRLLGAPTAGERREMDLRRAREAGRP